MTFEDHSKTKTEDLINLFQDPNTSTHEQDQVFLAIMFRFRETMVEKSEIICKNRGYDKDVARTIVEETFKKYNKSRNWKKNACNSKSVDECFTFYLNRIAKNVLNDYYRNKQKRENGLLYNGTEEIITQMPSGIDVNSLSPAEQVRHNTIMSLPEKQRVVYMTYAVHQRDGIKMPRKLLKELRGYLGISQITVQTYKKEATDKLKEAQKIIDIMNNQNHE